MVMIRHSKFQKWDFTDEELPLATTYTELQIKFMQTQIAEYAEDIINANRTNDDIKNDADYFMKVQFARGQIASLEHLLAMHYQFSEEARNMVLAARNKDGQDQQLLHDPNPTGVF